MFSLLAFVLSVFFIMIIVGAFITAWAEDQVKRGDE